MTVHHQDHRDRIDSGLGFEWDTLPPYMTSIEGSSAGQTVLRLQREKKSHKGVRSLKSLRTLWAYAVDQQFLDEICELDNLELLAIEKVTAKDFSGLGSLKKLKKLIIENGTPLERLDWIAALPELNGLSISNCKKLHDLQPLADCVQLRSLGVEGGMWEPMKVHSLQPLSKLKGLEYLFLTNLEVSDGSLLPLTHLSNLKVIQCANYFSTQEFLALSLALPNVRCSWLPSGGGQ